jgi:hypothetical protein
MTAVARDQFSRDGHRDFVAARQEMRDWHSTLEESRRRYREAFRKAYPVGSYVISIKRGRVQCQILKHGHADDCLVRSETGKQYWIDAYWIVGALKDESSHDTNK